MGGRDPARPRGGGAYRPVRWTSLIQATDDEDLVDEHRDFPDHTAAVEAMFPAAEQVGFPPRSPWAIVWSMGPGHSAPERVAAPSLPNCKGWSPLHPALTECDPGIEAVTARFPGLPQVACLTAFHRRMPSWRSASTPRDLWHEGIRRYGFHGLSYEYIMATLGAAAQGRLIIAHLGNGASLAAVHHGQPLDTSMGFTPTSGVMMGTAAAISTLGSLSSHAR